MKPIFTKFLSIDIVLRVLADVLIVNLALLTLLVLRYLWLVGVEASQVSPQATFQSYTYIYFQSCWLLTLIHLLMFNLSGLYSKGRFYQHRFKAIMIIQAVSVSYLIFGLLVLFLWDVISFPRSVLVPAWLLTILLLLGIRVAFELWQRFSQPDTLVPHTTKPARPKKILVIGGAGYIGSALLPKLLESGYKVRLLDLLLYGTEPIAQVLQHPNLEIIRADFRDIEAVVKSMQDVETVVHLGAIVGDPACALDETLTIEVNLIATRMIAEIAKASKISRFIFASTCSVYGASDEVLNEHSLLNPVSLYARSKIASEQVLMRLADDHFAPVILRFGTIYGLSGRTRFDLVINLLTAKAIFDQQITVFGGDQWRPFLHVDDAALSVFKALEAPLSLVRKQVFNVGSNEQNYTIQQVGEMIAQHISSAQLLNLGDDSDKRNYRVNFNKIRRTLGFVPQWTVEEGISQVVEAIQSGKIDDYQAAEYSNVKYLTAGEPDVAEFLRSQGRWAYDLLTETAALDGEMKKNPAGLQPVWAA